MIHLVVRRITDWEDETVVRAQLPASLRPTVELWNKPVPSDLSWCTPYIEMMRSLMAALRLRK